MTDKLKESLVVNENMFTGTQDFQDKHLIDDLDPYALRETIKKLYNLEHLTFSHLKQILKQGAKANNLVRMNDESFNQLVKVLDIPLEALADYGQLLE